MEEQTMKKWNAPEIEMANVNETACGGTTTETLEENSVSGATVVTEPLEDNHHSSCGRRHNYQPSWHRMPWGWMYF